MVSNFFKFCSQKKIVVLISMVFLFNHPPIFGQNNNSPTLPTKLKKVYLYNLVFGGFLNLGQATLTFSKEKKQFKAIMKVTPSGLAGFLSGYKEEYFEAQGKIEKDELLTNSFIRERKQENRTLKSLHSFNHTQKKIEFSEWEITGNKEKRTKNPKWLDFYVQRDVIASFFDLSLKLHQKSLKEQPLSFETLTLGEDKNKMTVSKENKKDFLFKVDLYEFDKKTKKHYGKKTFFLSTGKSGEFKSITIENLFWLGDLVGTLVDSKKMLKLTDQSED